LQTFDGFLKATPLRSYLSAGIAFTVMPAQAGIQHFNQKISGFLPSQE
jgi:hypothetical protein